MRLARLLAGWLVLLFAVACAATPTPSLTPTYTPTWTPKPTATPRLVVVYATPTPTLSLPRVAVTATATSQPVTPTATPTPTVVASSSSQAVNPLTGLPVDSRFLQRRPILVRVGNDPIIRPQEGLNAADILYEEMVDSLIEPNDLQRLLPFMTRITAVYLSQDPPKVWPVRSARLVSIALAREYHAALVHSGANDYIRYRLAQARRAGEDFIDLDELYHPSIFTTHREYDWRGRKSTDLRKVRQYLEAQSWEKAVPLRGFHFDETPPPDGQAATEVYIPYPACCDVTWRYNPETGMYERYVRGQPHIDRADGQIIAVSNVIVHFARHEPVGMIDRAYMTQGIRVYLDGEGEAWIFRDGKMYRARWRQTDRFQMTEYITLDGEPFPLKPGRTWIQFVPLDFDVKVR